MKLIIMLCLMFTSFSSSAAWLNTTGKVKSISVYAGKDTILVNLDSAGTKINECSSPSTFAISSTNTPEQRARLYSTLLAAQAAGRSVTLAYNDVGNCEAWGANAHAYRRIVRISLGG
ncbi:hypothetical protein [Shewanella woodyi]|uniref:Uncharacterized protein n=1 Tax=Shewanella woodyi (strain ATCC 51908 / MS32) TaxID=392500 RepID=B1KKE0_SHEWM|nr:hypothetical protein [Shewanella woodyi]ACA85780.1 conserved hypothetical protein [Shewanella woodyi ATCC 51908]